MIAEQYLNRSRLFRRLRNGPHGSYVELYASQLIKIGLSRLSTWRSLNLLGDLISWLTRIGSMPTELEERVVEQYFRRRSRKQSIQPGDRAALRRFLSVLREAGMIAPAIRPHRKPSRGRPSVIIEVLNTCTPGLELAVDIDKTVDPCLQARPAKAGPCIQFQRK